jgi:hypothetical protein
MTFKQLQKYLQGKVFLIGLTFIDKEGELIEQYQTHGIVSELTNNGLIKIERKDNSIFQMPYDKDTIKKAEKGEYKLRATKEVINDPDFIMTWEITTGKKDNIEKAKIHGFIPPVE